MSTGLKMGDLVFDGFEPQYVLVGLQGNRPLQVLVDYSLCISGKGSLS